MHRRNDEIERCETILSQVQGAVRPDVTLDAGEDGDALYPTRNLANPGGMGERAPFIQSVGHCKRLTVVGDRHVLAASIASSADHGLD